MPKPTVWVVKEQMMRGDLGSVAMDYSPAMKFGDIEFITHHDLPLHPHSSVRNSWALDVLEFVNKYDPHRDYLVATGQPMAILMVGYYLGMAGKAPQFLVWRPAENLYRVVGFGNTGTIAA